MDNGAATSLTYDAAGRMTRVADLTSVGATITAFDYSYDAAGNRTQEIDADGEAMQYTYDRTNQLVSEHRGLELSWNTLSLDEWAALTLDEWAALELTAIIITTHTYDPAGNRLVKETGGERTTYTYDDANRLQTAEDGGGLRCTREGIAGGVKQRDGICRPPMRIRCGGPSAGPAKIGADTGGEAFVAASI